MVDMVLRIRNKLADAEKQELPLAEVTAERLQKHIQAILSTLPEDLQGVLQNGSVLTPGMLAIKTHYSRSFLCEVFCYIIRHLLSE